MKPFPLKESSLSLKLSVPGVAHAVLAASLITALPVGAANLIINGSFEDPVAPLEGNNFYSSLPDWTLVISGSSLCSDVHNVIRPGVTFLPAPKDGLQYYDICSASGYLWQSFVIPEDSSVTFGAWFSRREFTDGGSTEIFDSSNQTQLSFSDFTVITGDEPQQTWKLSSASVLLPAGSYVFRVNLGDSANVDGAFVEASAIGISSVPEPSGLLVPLTLAFFHAAGSRRRASRAR